MKTCIFFSLLNILSIQQTYKSYFINIKNVLYERHNMFMTCLRLGKIFGLHFRADLWVPERITLRLKG